MGLGRPSHTGYFFCTSDASSMVEMCPSTSAFDPSSFLSLSLFGFFRTRVVTHHLPLAHSYDLPLSLSPWAPRSPPPSPHVTPPLGLLLYQRTQCSLPYTSGSPPAPLLPSGFPPAPLLTVEATFVTDRWGFTWISFSHTNFINPDRTCNGILLPLLCFSLPFTQTTLMMVFQETVFHSSIL
jgi:hypothetical protein